MEHVTAGAICDKQLPVILLILVEHNTV